MAKEVRGPVEQMLSVVLPGFERTGRRHHPQPFADVCPGFFDYLVDERGLRPASLRSAIATISTASRPTSRGSACAGISELSPAVLSAFIVERSAAGLAKSTVRDTAGVLRVFLRYAHREGVRRHRSERRRRMAAALPAVEHPAVDLVGRRQPDPCRR